METEALGAAARGWAGAGCVTVAGGWEVMGSGMRRGGLSAESRQLAERRDTQPHRTWGEGGGGAVESVLSPHPFFSSVLWGCSVKRLLGSHLINIHAHALFI